jgi:hypothetical protein
VDVMLNWAAEPAFIKNPRLCQEDNSVRKNFSQKVSGTRLASDDAVESPPQARLPKYDGLTPAALDCRRGIP